jgi:CheY-like chemotaxis protein
MMKERRGGFFVKGSAMARILVVEDDPNIRNLLVHFLQSRGYEVAAAADGLEGLKKVEEARPDLLVTDVMMPKMNGYQLVNALVNERQDLPTPKIVILTSRTDPADVKRGLNVGADAYIVKPFDLEDVAKTAGELLAGKSV